MSSTKYYYKDGTTSTTLDVSKPLHREDGPAIEYTDGTRNWIVDNKLHRIDGPAIVYANGDKQWFVDNNHYLQEGFNKLIKEVKELPLALRLIDPREWVREYKEKG